MAAMVVRTGLDSGRFDENPSMDPNYKAATRLPRHSFRLRYPWSKSVKLRGVFRQPKLG